MFSSFEASAACVCVCECVKVHSDARVCRPTGMTSPPRSRPWRWTTSSSPAQRRPVGWRRVSLSCSTVCFRLPWFYRSNLSGEETLNIKRRIQQKRKPLEGCCTFPTQLKATEVRTHCSSVGATPGGHVAQAANAPSRKYLKPALWCSGLERCFGFISVSSVFIS